MILSYCETLKNDSIRTNYTQKLEQLWEETTLSPKYNLGKTSILSLMIQKASKCKIRM